MFDCTFFEKPERGRLSHKKGRKGGKRRKKGPRPEREKEVASTMPKAGNLKRFCEERPQLAL